MFAAELVFWGYNLFIVLAALGYVLGVTQSREYAEPAWAADLWLAGVWLTCLELGRDGQLLGILTEGDLMRRVETGTEGKPPGWLSRLLRPGREAGQYVATHGRRVGEVMTSAVFSVGPDTPLADVVTMMLRHRVKRLPVVQHGQLLGIVSRADLVRRVGQLLDAAPVSADDATIRRTILDTMARERWAPRTMLDITVKDAVVQLDGCVFDMRERDALGVLAENVPGVTRVENRIVCVEPYAGTVTFDPAAPM